jgi:hypothetical protein
VDDALPPNLYCRVEAVDVEVVEVEGDYMNGAFGALNSRMRCCNR